MNLTQCRLHCRTAAFLFLALSIVSCGGESADEVLTSLSGLGDAESDFQFALQVVESEIDKCMASEGLAEWRDARSTSELGQNFHEIYLDLPQILEGGDAPIGYEAELEALFDQGYELDHESGTDAGLDPTEDIDDSGGVGDDAYAEAVVDALLGPVDSDDFVAYFAPGLGEVETAMAGCQGAGHRAVISDDDLPMFLAGSYLVTNLAMQVRSGALVEASDSVEAWSRCMANSGFRVQNPFAVATLAPLASSAEVARVDLACREDSNVDEGYREGLRMAIEEIGGDVTPTLNELERISSQVRSDWN